MQKNKVLVVGTIAFDEVETPSGSSGKVIAGSATYISLATSLFEVESAIVSIVGRDFPKDYLEVLTDRNINMEGVEIDNTGDTFYWKGRYHKDMNRRDTLVTDLNTLANFNPIVPNAFKDAKVALLGNLHPDIQNSVISQINLKNTTIILDTMNFWIERTWDELMQVVSKTDIITINDEEAFQMTGKTNILSAAKQISDMGPSYVIIKKGEHGSLLYHNDQNFLAPAVILDNVVEPTGAGDTFAGGMAGFLASQAELNFEVLKTAMVYGSSVASFCVTDFGTKAIVNTSISQIKKRVDMLKKSVDFKSF
jgi:sugar/nucleoside kinase (ribokinase family)